MTEYFGRIEDAREAEGMAYKDDMQKVQTQKGRVTRCEEPVCDLKRLDTWDKRVWISYSTDGDYEEYSHGICPAHFEVKMKEYMEWKDIQK